MIGEWKWALACTAFLAALIVLLYFRARAQAHHKLDHMDRKIDGVQQAVGDVKSAVEISRQQVLGDSADRRAETRYLAAMVEGHRKEASAAAEGIRTALHASDQKADRREEQSGVALKGFQLTIFRQFLDLIKKAVDEAVRIALAKLGKNQDPPPPDGNGEGP